MTLFFDARELGEPSSEYVAWIDVMGIQGALRRSIKIAANFVYKLHDAALQARTGRLRLYPIMDGFYASSPDSETLGAFLRQVFRSSAQEFVSQEKELFRFLIKGALARGEVYHGSELRPNASTTLHDNQAYRDQILLGQAMVQAHLGETEAPPFGVYVDGSAQEFLKESESFPFDVWWRWYQAEDSELLQKLRVSLESYFNWWSKQSTESGYAASRIRIHRGQAALYLGNS
jgi:hypothetical protein